jgi:hypothetical protein
MKLKTDVLSNNDVDSTTTTKKMGFAKGSESMQFKAFTEYIYSNPIGSLVREITSNCFDSHVEAGVENTPVLIKKTYDHQTDTYYISFIDYGVGLSEQRIEDIYMNYFASTKRDSDSLIGGWGLGSKTPLAYKRFTGEGDTEYDNSFFIITVYDGIKYYYTIFEGKKSPEYNLFHNEKTNERNGTEVRIPVLQKDIHKFEHEMKQQLYYFEGIVFEGFSENVENDYQIVRSKNFLYRGNDIDRKIHVCLGKVYYPINYSTLRLNEYDYQIPIAIDVPIGKVGVTLSRENLDYSEQTIKYLKKRIDDVMSELKGMLSKQYQNVQTLKDYFELNDNFGLLKLTDNKSINLKGFVKKSEIDLTKFKYSMFKTPSSSVLFELFFKVKRYGKKETSRSWNDDYSRLKRDYNGIVSADNIFYSKAKEFKVKRIRQSYLKYLHGRYYLIFKMDLTTQWASICDVFNVHFDTQEDFINSDMFKNLLKMQEEYYNIVQENAQCYEEVEIPDDFRMSYGRSKLTGDILKTTIPIRMGRYTKERVKIKDLVDFNGKIFYSTPDDENEADSCRSIFRELYDHDYNFLADSYYMHSPKNHKFGGNKKSIMIITLAKNNLKYMKYCKNAYPLSHFYYNIVQRKEGEIIKQIMNNDIKDKVRYIDTFYKSELFKELSPQWKGKIEKIENFINNLSIKYRDIHFQKNWLSKYINFDEIDYTPEEKTVRKHIDSLLNLQKDNEDILDVLSIRYNVDSMNDRKKEIISKMLKSVMSF